jgi:hypothetical protein
MRPISARRNGRASSMKSRYKCFYEKAGFFSGSPFFGGQGRDPVEQTPDESIVLKGSKRTLTVFSKTRRDGGSSLTSSPS